MQFSLMPKLYKKRSGFLQKESIRDQIRQAILDGSLAPGQPLRQESLGTKYRVSRLPIREGLQYLESEGLVIFTPARGFFVSGLKPRDIEEVYELRISLEGLATRIAVPTLGSEQLNVMSDWLDKMDGELDLKAWHEQDQQFHTTLYNKIPNARLMTSIKQLRANVGRYIRMDARQLDHKAAIQAEHRAILQACKAKDVRAARKAVVAHLELEHDRLMRR